jgi:tetratricopeptide (TPR) repeat protein
MTGHNRTAGTILEVTEPRFVAAWTNTTTVPALPASTRTTATERAARVEEARLFLEIAAHARGDFWPGKAARFARRALWIFERELGANHPDFAKALICLAGAYADEAENQRAEEHYRRALRTLRRMADGDLDVQRLHIDATRGLANVMLALGRSQEAETMLRAALVMAERAAGHNSAEAAHVLSDLGVLHMRTGRLDVAASLHRHVLTILDQGMRHEDQLLATTLNHLGAVEHTRGMSAAGESFVRRSIEVRERVLGPDHPRVAADWSALGAILEAQGRYDEAESAYRRAFTILERWFGPNHRDAAAAAAKIAALFLARIKATEQERAASFVRPTFDCHGSASPEHDTRSAHCA